MIRTLSNLKSSHFISLMGQSNASGYNTPDADENQYNPRLGQYIFDNVSMEWQALQQNKNNGGKYYSYVGFQGIEMKLMQLLKNYYGADQYIFKYSEAAAPIALGDDPDVFPYNWSPLSAHPQNYKGCVNNFNYAKTHFPAQMPRMKVLIWIHGESDVNTIDADNYQRNFITFINALKNDWNTPGLKVIQTLLSDTQTFYNQSLKAVINNAKINLSVNGNRYVNTDGAETQSGGVHFTTSGYEDIAQRVFDVLITML